MNEDHYRRYCALVATGLRSAARPHLIAFIDSFASLAEMSAWTRSYLGTKPRREHIRHELFQRVIFPVLLDGYRKRDRWSMLWLARTNDNICAFPDLRSQLNDASSYHILKQLYGLFPGDLEVRAELLDQLLEGFRYSIHGWPAGILAGTGGTTVADCRELLDDVALALTLDKDDVNTAFLRDVEAKVQAYIVRLKHRHPVNARTDGLQEP